MRVSTVSPVNVPSEFRIDEMFFSTTDGKGVIRMGNAVFARVSGYSLAELVGQPHNIIRHPDMPRVVFRLLWDYLRRDLPVAALVKNMAKDGRYYWVVALVTPVPGGFLSVRFKPSAAVSLTVQGLYEKLRAVEKTHGDAGEEGRAGMDAAQQVLVAELGRLGFASYDHFMWRWLHDEMKSRDRAIGGFKTVSAGEHRPGASTLLRSIEEGAVQAYQQINSLYQWLDELTSLHDRLVGRSKQVYELTHNIRFVALSTTIKSARLGHEGRSLGTIAHYLSEASARTAQEVQQMTAHLQDVSAELHAVIFNLAGARLQLEMMLFFVGELQRTDPLAGGVLDRPALIDGLQRAFHATTRRSIDFLNTFGRHLAGLAMSAETLRRTILSLHVAQIGGKVEASRINSDGSIMDLLSEIQTHIDSTVVELDDIGAVTNRFTTLIHSVPGIAQAIDAAIGRIERDTQELSRQNTAAPAAESLTPRATTRPPPVAVVQNSAVPGVRAKGMTSRILATPVTNINRRSNPSPKPACGTVP